MDNRFLHEGLSVNIGAPFSLRIISGLGHIVEPFLLFAWKLTSLCLYCSTCSLYSSGNIPSSMSCREEKEIQTLILIIRHQMEDNSQPKWRGACAYNVRIATVYHSHYIYRQCCLYFLWHINAEWSIDNPWSKNLYILVYRPGNTTHIPLAVCIAYTKRYQHSEVICNETMTTT